MSLLKDKEVKNIWKLATNELKLLFSQATYNTWILPNPLVEVDIKNENEAVAVISAATAFHATNLEKKFKPQIQNILEKTLNKKIDLLFKVNYKKNLAEENQFLFTKDIDESTSSTLEEKKENFNNFSTFSTHTDQPDASLFSQNTIKATLSQRALLAAKRIGLRINATFKNFAVSSSNEMAYSAALAVAKNPGQAYNPLFFYGGVGVGKTHLMHAIANFVLQKNPDMPIIYSTGEEFTNSIINAIQTKKTIQFKNKYRKAKILLIDDIQFIAGKTAVQEEFFHTFNALIQNFSQIVLTSDRPPSEIALLEDRLRSRFEAGLMIDIGQPSKELRTAIVLIKAQEKGLNLPMKFAQIIAEKITSARRIEGIITTIHSRLFLSKKKLDEELIYSLLKRESQINNTTTNIIVPKPNDVIKKAAKYFQLKPIDIKGKKRQKTIVRARHIAMYFLKTQCNMSYSEIGRWFSNRDHTSVMHAVKKIEQDLDSDQILQEDLTNLKLMIIK